MPVHTIKFNLPEEQEELEAFQTGVQAHIVIEDVFNYLRSKLKYGTPSKTEARVYTELRDKLCELMKQQGL